MRTRVSSADQGCLPRWRLLICDGRVLAVVAVWLLTSCVSMHAEDSKPDKHVRTPAAQQNLPTAKTAKKDEKTETANGADSPSCKIKSDDPAIATSTGEAALPAENSDQERMSKASHKAPAGENLTLPAPSREEWTKDQIHLGAETTLREESRTDKYENSRAGSDLKCTPHEATPTTEPAMPN
jgi:hypothetical protein